MTNRSHLFRMFLVLALGTLPNLSWAESLCTGYAISKTMDLSPDLEEISGFALSRTNPKYLWAHTDSGGESALYVLDLAGQLKATLKLYGGQNVDWEDIAVGPCEAGSDASCIYIGDMGDNLFSRHDKKIYVVKEPMLPDTWTAETTVDPLIVWKTIPVHYPSSTLEAKFANPDCESLMVSPQGEIYVVSKQSNGGDQTLYHVRRDDEHLGDMEPLSSYAFTSQLGSFVTMYNAVTAADFASDGSRFLVRTYAHVYEYDLEQYPDIAEAFQHPHAILGNDGEIQGEAVAYLANDRSIATASEKRLTDHARMHIHTCITSPIEAAKKSMGTPYKPSSGLHFIKNVFAIRTATEPTEPTEPTK